MGKYIVFGAGDYGSRVTEYLGKENIEFYIDNSLEKQKKGFNGVKVYSLAEAVSHISNEIIVIAVSCTYYAEIIEQLGKIGIKNFVSYKDIQVEKTKEKLQKRTDYIKIYNKAIKWVQQNSILNEGIINNTELKKSYPEVTGYYIPTLIKWGYRNLAVTYAKWLCKIQKDDGSWYDTNDKAPYIFDSAQILKGLIEIRDICPEVDVYIKRGCDWILSCMTEEGRLVAPIDGCWGDGKTCSELIHTYCLSPLVKAGEIFEEPRYKKDAYKILRYYIENYYDEMVNFNLLSHFYAYVMEALLDMQEVEIVKEAMSKIAEIQKDNGVVPAYKGVDWVCSTGLFQLALVWFRLGEVERGNKAFEYACKLQNDSGGWYGSYLCEDNLDEENNYFPNSEISWAIKYFLDALYYKNLSQFENQATIFRDEISITDGRYHVIENCLLEIGTGKKVLDVGCGKGCYLKNLIKQIPQNSYYAVDLSTKVMNFINEKQIEKKQGTLTNVPYVDDFFDMVYTCEALEHAIDIKQAIKEMARVTHDGGTIIVIDKNKEMLGYFDIEEWEQWFDGDELRNIMMDYCSRVEIVKEISFDEEANNGLFYAWIGTVKK